MNSKTFYLILLSGLIFGTGCKKDNSPDTTAQLRIFNSTPWTFYDCTVKPAGTLSDNPGQNAHNYGQVDINAKTSYMSFSKVYRYSWVGLTMNNKTYHLVPYDYTGETPLESGNYTYKLTFNSNLDQLNLELIKD